jgi:L-alanine-DL-glutamate epimerase-like enolase superfamily enzyme
MPAIASVRPVLLSAPYAGEGNLEVRLHLPSGLRTTGLVEIRFDDGTVGLGEGYLAVFAPKVFTAIVDLVAPFVIGRSLDDLAAIVRDIEIVTGYWSFQGAARHVVAAFEIALQDARAQRLGVPLWRALGGTASRPLPAYASGGDSVDPSFMAREIADVAALGIRTFKIRARRHQADKAVWCARAGAAAGIGIAVDMAQNLAIPSQSADDVLAFVAEHDRAGVARPAFLEEVQGPQAIADLPDLRAASGVPIAGGEIVTTPEELEARVRAGCYDIVQPDATVIGGIGPVMQVFAAARDTGTRVYVHCWGAGVGMLANYHAAVAGGGAMVEWPMPAYPLREALFAAPLGVADGRLVLPETAGLGARLTPEIERAFPFREEAVYRCLVDASAVPAVRWP